MGFPSDFVVGFLVVVRRTFGVWVPCVVLVGLSGGVGGRVNGRGEALAGDVDGYVDDGRVADGSVSVRAARMGRALGLVAAAEAGFAVRVSRGVSAASVRRAAERAVVTVGFAGWGLGCIAGVVVARS